MPNPSGSNQFYIPEPAYGDVKKMDELTKEAPMSGAPTPAVNAPERAQYQAVQGSRSASKTKKAPGAPPDYYAELAATWAELANAPGASPFLRQIAERASRNGA